MSEDEDMLDLDGAAVDASDLDKLLVSLSSVQAKGAKRPKYTGLSPSYFVLKGSAVANESE